MKIFLMSLFMLFFMGCNTADNSIRVVTHSTIVSNKKVININTACKTLLCELDGIGEKKANRIIESRNKEKFTGIHQLIERKLIGKTTFNNIREDITIDTAPNQHSGCF